MLKIDNNYEEKLSKIIQEQADLRDSVGNVVASQKVVIKAMVVIRKAQEDKDKIVEDMGELIKVMSDEIRELKGKTV